MIFRTADVSDVPALAAMRWSFRGEEGEVPGESQEAFAKRFGDFVSAGIRSGDWTYWLAETDERELASQMAVGVIPSIPRPSRASDQWGYLTDCYTLPRFRNQGVGSALLTRIAQWAAARDLEMILVWPSEKALSLYTKAGFTRDDEVRVLQIRAYDDPIRPRADA